MLFTICLGVYLIACVLGCVWCFSVPAWCKIMEWTEIPCNMEEATVWAAFISVSFILFCVSAVLQYRKG